MNAFLSLGRWLFAIPFAIFGAFHFMNPQAMAMAVPSYMPGGVFWVYLTGVALIAASVSMLIGKYDKLAAALLAIFILLMVLMVNLPMLSDPAQSQMATGMLLKNVVETGAAMIYAQYVAKDRSIIG